MKAKKLRFNALVKRLRREYPRLLILGALFAIVAILAVGFIQQNYSSDNKTLEQYASDIVAECSSADYRPLCYEQRVPLLLNEISMGEAFDVVRVIRELDDEYAFCHVLGHELGGQEVAKDPQQWLDVLTQCPRDGLCSSGCLHGTALERFSAEVFTEVEIELALPGFQQVCETREGYNPTPFNQATCYHGIGHLAAHMGDGDVLKAIGICDRAVATQNEHHIKLCVEGIYMQYYQPLEPEDFALIDSLEMKPTAQNLKEFCKKYSRNIAEEGACWREGWPPFFDEIFSPNGFEDYCSYMTDKQQYQLCLTSVFTISGRLFQATPDRVKKLCSYVSGDQQKMNCYLQGAITVLEEETTSTRSHRLATSMCEGAQPQSLSNDCMKALASIASFHFHVGSPEFEQFCSVFPDELKAQCLSSRR